jgi:hypothetical protein
MTADGERKMLDVLVEGLPRRLTRVELADPVGFERCRRTFGAYLATLRRSGLAEVAVTGVQARAAVRLGSGTPGQRAS